MLENFELPITELKYTYRVKELEKAFQKEEISLVALDVDDTVVDTSLYFRESMNILNVAIAHELYPNEDPEIIAKEISDAIFLAYENNDKKPELINERYKRAIPLYTNKPLSSNLVAKIDNHFLNFYKESPEIFDKTPQFINSVLAAGIPIVFHSHAQEESTKIKIDNILKACGLDKQGISLPFLGTPLNKDKDAKSWAETYSLANTYFGINVSPEHVLNIGDNWNADIYPAFQAGCRNFVWINNSQEKKETNESKEWVNSVNLVESKEIGLVIDDLLS
jgi:phosphoglycolate phosphatase-like HAD superfamily hydrolase